MNKTKKRLYIEETLKNKKTCVDGGKNKKKIQKMGKKIQKTNIWDHRKKSSPPPVTLRKSQKLFLISPHLRFHTYSRVKGSFRKGRFSGQTSKVRFLKSDWQGPEDPSDSGIYVGK